MNERIDVLAVMATLEAPVARNNVSCADIDKARTAIAELIEAAEGIIAFADALHDYWDRDDDMKVGKGLLAIAGHMPGYSPKTRRFHAALARVQGDAA